MGLGHEVRAVDLATHGEIARDAVDALTSRDVGRLIQMLRGLTFFEVKKVMTQTIAENWKLDEGSR